MVELVEVEDESFETKQVGPEENDDDYYTDTGLSFCSPAPRSASNSIQTLKSLPMTKTMCPMRKHWQNVCLR